jgi:hypothetical protein
MWFVMIGALVITIISLIAVPLRLASNKPVAPQTRSGIANALLLVAGILSGLMTLMILAAAAWGMDTRPPWGLGVYMYLIPALSLPAFLLLRFSSVRTLSRVFWLLTLACAIAWHFGDRSDRIASGMQPVSDPMEIMGTYFNTFTILYVMISILLQVAAVCRRKQD